MHSSLSLLSTRRLYLGGLKTPITVTIWRDDESGRLSVDVSHILFTPGELEPMPLGLEFASCSSFAAEKSARDAFRRVAMAYDMKYVAATATHQMSPPDESWLIPSAGD